MRNRFAFLVIAVFLLAVVSCQLIAPAAAPTSTAAPAIPSVAPAEPTITPPSATATTPAEASVEPAVDWSAPAQIESQEFVDQQLPRYGIQGHYPRISAPAGPAADGFNAIARGYVDGLVAEFQTNLAQGMAIITPDANAPSPQNFLSSEYQLMYNDHGLVSIYTENSQYFYGAAHPNPFSSVINYSLPLGRELALADLFQPGTNYLQAISMYSINELRNNEAFMFEEGAQPVEVNYQKWNITPEGLRITFDPYQVAAYAAGYLRVTIPWDVLRDQINPAGPLGPLFN